MFHLRYTISLSLLDLTMGNRPHTLHTYGTPSFRFNKDEHESNERTYKRYKHSCPVVLQWNKRRKHKCSVILQYGEW